MSWNIRGLENPSSDEFLENPDFRQIAAFFLGWVFFYSVQIILSSPLLRGNFTRACFSLLSLITKSIKRHHEPNDIEAPAPPAASPGHEEKTPGYNTESSSFSTVSQLREQEGNALLVTLALCFTCASVAYFASLLQYTTAGGTACAFVVAWGGTAAQAGRLTGLLILSLELKQFSARRREVYIFWALLSILLGLVFANNAIAVGALRPVSQLRISLCYRRHFTPTGLASSLALISTELYLIIRFIFIISPRGLGWFTKLDLLSDSRVYRSLSLLVLDVLTITSAAKPTNLLVDFIPFAVGATVVLFAFDLASPKKEIEAAPPAWSYYGETRRFALHPTPAHSVAPTLSIRRASNRTTYTISPPSPGSSENDPPPAPTRSALSLRVALRNFTAQEQQNSRAVIDGHTKTEAESQTLPSPTTTQSPRSARSSIRRFFSMRSGHPETQSNRQSLRKGYKPQVAIVINTDEQAPDVPQLPGSSITPNSGVDAADFRRMPPPRKRSNRIGRSSTSSGLTYLTPVSQKNVPGRRPSYLLSPSRSHRQSIASTPHTPIPTWEEMYRQQGLQIDPRLEIPPVPSRSGSFNHQSASPCTPTVPPIPLSPASPPPGLWKLQPIIQSSLLANTPPVERTRGIKGPRPLIVTSRPRVRPPRDDT